jgi:purine-binding chemotaxis protein CheW
MSPKRKKVEAALKNLFSNSAAPKPKQKTADENSSEAAQQSIKMVADSAEKPTPKSPRTPRTAKKKAVSAAEIKTAPPETADNKAKSTASRQKDAQKLAEVTETKPAGPALAAPKPELESVEAVQKPNALETKTVEKPRQPDQDVQSAQEPKKEIKKILDATQLVIFKLADEYYGVRIDLVESIIKMQPYTIVPNVPNYIVGVTNLRGYVLPIVDLRTRFSLPKQEETHNTRIMVLLIKGEKVGMIVDEVNEVARVLSDDIDPTPALIVNINMEFVEGIAKLRDENKEFMRMAILLNMEKALKVK